MIRNDFSNVRYGIKDGFKVNKKYAQPAGEIMAVMESNNELTAKNLVDVSRDEDAPLHDYFEWDDAVAAEAFREEQGRYLIRAIVRIEESDNPDQSGNEPVKVYYAPETADPHYWSIETICKSEDKAQKLYLSALSELKRFEHRFQIISDRLKPVFDAIDGLSA